MLLQALIKLHVFQLPFLENYNESEKDAKGHLFNVATMAAS